MGKSFRTDVDLTIRLFDTLIKPILLYGSEVWGIESKPICNDPIEAVQTKFCKMLLGVNAKATNNACRSELGIFPLRAEMTLRPLKYWTRYMNAKDRKLSSCAIKGEFNAQNKLNWAGKIKVKTDKLGLSYLTCHDTYLNIDKNGNITNLTDYQLHNVNDNIKQRILDQEFQTWEGEIHNDSKKANRKNKMRTYRTFKTTYTREGYLREVSNIKHRISLTKLRISDHSLHIETGRYTKPYTEAHERICNLCKKEVEDEKHFLLRCEVFNDERALLINNIENKLGIKFYLFNENKQFHTLINPNEKIQKIIAKYVHNCFQKRMKIP